MATNFDNNALASSGGFKPSTKDTPIDIRSRVQTESDILDIPNPYVGMIVYVIDTGKRFEVQSIKDVQQGLSKVSRVNEYKEFMVGSSQGGTSGVDLTPYAKTEYVDEQINNLVIPEKVSDLDNDLNYASETFVNNAIANAQLGGEGGEVNLDGLVAKNEIGNASQILFSDGQSFQTKLDNGSLQGPKGADGLTTSISVNGQTFTHENGVITLPNYPQAGTAADTYSREQIDAIIQDYTGGKKQVYLTQEQYDLLTDTEKNDITKVYNITDATEQEIPTDLTINSNNLLQLKDANGNAIGTGVTISTTSGGSGMTNEEVNTVLMNVFGENYLPQINGN